jgi:AcrR family transcriptional regulator
MDEGGPRTELREGSDRGRRKPKRSTREDSARETREALIRAGLQVVARYGYAKASVARITQASGVAAGTLYSYFESHSKFLDQLLPAEGERLFEALAESAHLSADYFDHERRAFSAFFEYLNRRPYLVRVLSEAEIAAPESYALHMRNTEARYLRALKRAQVRGEIRPQSDRAFRVIAEVLSGARGHIAVGFSDRSGARAFRPAELPDWVADTYVKFIRHGIQATVPEPAARSAQRPRRAPERPRDTHDALLHAAARVIQTHGYAGASIQAITAAAGVAVGTFYSHFASRQALFDEILGHMRARMLSDVREQCHGSTSFAEMESRGFHGFFDHLMENPWYVRIETEAAVWAPTTYVKHFFDIADRYTRALRTARERGELAAFADRELPVLAYILMAARHYLATRYVVATATPRRLPAALASTYVELVCQGLQPGR